MPTVLTLRRRALLVALLAVISACTPDIGDKCNLSTDCSLRGERLCDTSQPGGYCTILDCRGNLCPEDSACVLFKPAVPGCGYSDQRPSRTGRAFCVAVCSGDSDCRSGYVCADPRGAPWSALILDDNQAQRICIGRPDSTEPLGSGLSGPDAGPPVCRASAPDAGPIRITDAGRGTDAGGADAGDAAADAGEAGTDDAGADAGDAGAPDAGDAGIADAADSG